MIKNDPYHDIKTYHKASKIAPDGSVSPLCAKTPYRLNLKTDTWTLQDSAVTCRKCRKLLKYPGVDIDKAHRK